MYQNMDIIQKILPCLVERLPRKVAFQETDDNESTLISIFDFISFHSTYAGESVSKLFAYTKLIWFFGRDPVETCTIPSSNYVKL